MELEVVRDDTVQIRLHGRLDADQVPRRWRQVSSELERVSPKRVEIDATEVDYCDGCGISLLTYIQRRQADQGGQVEIQGLKPKFQQLLTLLDPGQVEAPVREGTALVRLAEDVGRAAICVWQDLHAQVSFVGENTLKLLLTDLVNSSEPRQMDISYAPESDRSSKTVISRSYKRSDILVEE